MDSTRSSGVRQRAPNYPATQADVEEIREKWPHLLIHRGRPVETIGKTLARQIDGIPDPLPDGDVGRFAATVAAKPVFFGRLCEHAINAAREVSDG